MRLYRESLLAISSLLAFTASAARISVYDAQSAARAFAAEGHHLAIGLGSSPQETREHLAADGSTFFSVRMTGGGTIFLSGDDNQEPIIAFSASDIDFENLDPASPLYALLHNDAAVRPTSASAPAKWNRLLASGDSLPAYPSLLSVIAQSTGLTTPGDIRVPALVETKWGQGGTGENSCYKLYTPGNAVCGCVATAMSQIMRCHRWPDAAHAVAANTVTCGYNGVATNLTMQGGTYDWTQMACGTTADPINTAAKREAIGKLTSDVGISMSMSYSSGGSATYSSWSSDVFMGTWHYGQSTYLYDYDNASYGYINGDHGEQLRIQTLQKALFANFDCGCPVMLGIGNHNEQPDGHCIVADGYGYQDGVDYVHLNFGWSGLYDLWYNLPTTGTTYDFDSVTEVVYNIFPTNDTSCAAFSGRVVDSSTNAVSAAKVIVRRTGYPGIVAETETSDSGVYGVVLPGGRYYDVMAISADMTRTGTIASVSVIAPVVKSYYELGCNRCVMPDGTIGNSWGNDIVLGDVVYVRTDPTNFYVSASSGVDAKDRGTSAAPYATIQYAITNGQTLVAGDVINVLPGMYYGCVETPETAISIVSTEGPDSTILDGLAADCCYCGSSNPQNLFAGFTITNGAYCGGIYYGTVTNCVVLNCDSSWYGHGGGAYGATLYGCVLHNNEARYGGGAANCVLVNCTVYDNWASYAGGGVDCQCTVTNSIVWRNTITYNYEEENWYQTGSLIPSFAYSCTTPSGFTDLGNNITNDPKCVSFDIDDWRLRSGSPCVGSALGGLNMGAWQGMPVIGYVITAEANGHGSVSPWSQFVPEGDDATFTATGDHPFLNFETNGVMVSTDRSYTWPDVHADGTLTANFGTTNYCIDAVAGNDDNDGLSWTAPLKSIYAMTQKAGRGDTVKVKPGVYDFCDWCVYGVEVNSTDGAASTFITGGGTNRCIYAYDMLYRGFTFCNGNLTGYGGGAYGGTFVDCVFSNCTAAIGGGAAYATMTNCLVIANSAFRVRQGMHGYEGGHGGGVYECDLFNCTLSGNTAYYYGGGAYLNEIGEARNSIVCGNTSTSGSEYGNDIYGNHYWTMSNSLSDVDAKFRDAANGDYRLLPTSPAFDAGSMDFVSVDHDLSGTNRVWGDSVDIGCFEYHLPSPSMTDPTNKLNVAAALKTEGYDDDYAEAVKTAKDYAYLVEWTANNELTATDLNKSSTGFISPALDADGLMSLDPTNIVFQSFSTSDCGTNWNIVVSLPGYNRSNINLPLLKSALSVIGSEDVKTGYTTNDLAWSLTPASTNIIFSIKPPEDKSQYFLKLQVK